MHKNVDIACVEKAKDDGYRIARRKKRTHLFVKALEEGAPDQKNRKKTVSDAQEHFSLS